MDVAITGARGLIGSALSAHLRAEGHGVVPVTRSPAGQPGAIGWDPAGGTIDAAGLEGLDAVVHLAGEPIAARPWTTAQRRRIHDSRSRSTALLAETLAGLGQPPATLVSGSAIGYYGDRGDEVLAETSPPGDDFLSGVCLDWEAATGMAAEAGIRVIRIRTGIVLSTEGGALATQLPVFKLGLGGPAGGGDQWMAWIHLDDEVAAIAFLLETEVSGPVNLTGPDPVTNADFARTLGAVLGRPTFLRVPRLVTKLPLGVGDLADSLLFVSQRVTPTALERAGYRFTHTELEPALANLVG